MRLEDYLIEITDMTAHLRDLEKDFIDWFKVIGQVLDKQGWWITDEDMVDVLNIITMPDGIQFHLIKKKSTGKYISSARFGGESVDRGIYFQVWVLEGFADYFRRFEKPNRRKMFLDVNRNAFLRELYEVLAHETAHAMQAISISDTGDPEAYDRRTKQQDLEKDLIGYYSDPREIEAYALQAAIEYIRLNQSRVIDIYNHHFKENNPKVWKKFLKKYSYYKKQVKKSGVMLSVADLMNKRGK